MPWELRARKLDGSSPRTIHHATDKHVTIGLPMRTCQWQVNLDHRLADFFLEGDALIEAWEHRLVGGTWTHTQHFAGELVDAEEQADAGAVGGGRVVCAAMNPWWNLAKRLIGKLTQPGGAAGYSLGTALAPVDRGLIVKDIWQVLEAEENTRIEMGLVTPSSSSWVSPQFYRSAQALIIDLIKPLDGPEIKLTPRTLNAGKIAVMDIAPFIGTLNRRASWEYGGGKRNVQSYRRPVSKRESANQIFSLPSGYPDNATSGVLTDADAASRLIRGLLEDVITSDVTVDDLRQKLLGYSLLTRANPRETITMQPVRDLRPGRVPAFGVDWDVGDVMPFRAWKSDPDSGGSSLRLDVVQRCYEADFAIDESGAATPTLIQAPDATSDTA